MRLGDLLKDLPKGSFQLHGSPDVPVTGITYDSRQVRPGFVFVPWRGGLVHGDGHRFIPHAVAAGAAVIVAEQGAVNPASVREGAVLVEAVDTRLTLGLMASAFYGHPSRRLRLIGVTGTNGKTTTTHLVRHLLQQAGLPVGLIGTVYNVVGGRRRAGTLTTPQAPELQALLAEMVAAGDRYALMEVASHALHQQRTAGCRFDVGVFTNLSQDHLDYHGSMEAYRDAKARLFAGLARQEAGAGRPYAVINADDPAGRHMAPGGELQTVWYGLSSPADIMARNIRITSAGTSFQVVTAVASAQVTMPLVGRFNVYNALAALAVALGEGMDLQEAAAALAGAAPIDGRFQQVDLGQPFTVIVDYAHTPDGLEKVLTTAREFTRGRLWVVFGAGGDRDRAKRPVMGAVAARLADMVILTSDNPRSEDPEQILSEIERGARAALGAGDNLAVVPDRGEAIAAAIQGAGPGDVVVIAGKGHETYQIFRHETIHFDDREVAAAAIRRRLAAP